MIFYFSGTGNSQLAAKQLAALTNDELVSINQCIKEGGSRTYHTDRPLVFVAPTYAWRIPRVVERWLMDTCFEGSKDSYFILTCGDSSGNAAAYAKKLCSRKKLQFCGFSQVLMPENYLAMFPTPDEAAYKALRDRAKPCIAALAVSIRDRRVFPESAVSFMDKMLSGLVNPVFYPLLVHDKRFTVSEGCVSCGKCAKRCPLNNIDLVNGKPLWKGRCTHCMACIGGCPTEAIEYGSKSKGKNRYYIMEE